MGKLQFISFGLAALGVVACKSNNGNGGVDAHIKLIDATNPDAKMFNDAPAPPTYDFSCVGNAAPTSAPATLTFAGTVTEETGSILMPGTPGALAGATVKVCTTDCAAPLDTQTSAATTGTFQSAAVATPGGNSPIDGYILTSDSGHRTTYIYPASPFTANSTNLPVLLFVTDFFSLAQTGSKGLLGVAASDCANTPITDTTNLPLSIKENGTEVTGDSIIDASMYSSMASGAFVVLNVPASTAATVGATYHGTNGDITFRAHAMIVVAGGTSSTIVRPGY